MIKKSMDKINKKIIFMYRYLSNKTVIYTLYLYDYILLDYYFVKI